MRSVPHRGSEWVLTVDSMYGPTRYRVVVLTSCHCEVASFNA